MLRKIKESLLPKGAKPRKIYLGLARGTVASVDFSLDTAFYFGLHENVLHRHYRRLVKPGMKCFDIGCYRGWDALSLARITGAEVLSFEGSAKQVEAATAFLAPSAQQDRIRILNAYVTEGAESGQISIDRAADEYFVPDFIKMDIEGHEGAALRGATCVLTERRPPMIIEVHGTDVEADCIAVLDGLGYGIEIVDRRKGAFEEARGEGHNRWIVCTHPAAAHAAPEL